MKLTSAEESYLFTIHHLSDGSNVSTNKLAQKMGVAAASVTDMVQKLAEKDYVKYEKYKGVRLLPNGIRIAKQLSQTKALWSEFLTNHLQLSNKESTSLLEELQHIQSKELQQHLYRYLQQTPEEDKDLFSTLTVEDIIEQEHPNNSSLTLLSTVEMNTSYYLKGLKTVNQEIIDIISSLKLNLGSQLVVKQKFTLDDSLLVLVNGHELVLSNVIASYIIVEKL